MRWRENWLAGWLGLASYSGVKSVNSPSLPACARRNEMAAKKQQAKAKTNSRATDALSAMFDSYWRETSDRLKFIDAFLVFVLLSGITQFLYCVLVTNFPFNAFLAG